MEEKVTYIACANCSYQNELPVDSKVLELCPECGNNTIYVKSNDIYETLYERKD